jgi:heme/copper-type cytochrome/quinol oxidase subunit 3
LHDQSAAGHEVVIEETTTGLNHRKLLMWLFLGSDCLFFGSFIATYLIYRGQSLVGPFPKDIFDIPTTSVSTFALLMSSMSMVLAYASINRGNMKAFRIWLISTCILGTTFLAFQTFEFYEFANYETELECTAELHDQGKCPDGVVVGEEFKADYGLTPKTNLFGSTFFTLTGFHGAHVTVGVIWLLSIAGYSMLGGRRANRILTDRQALSVDLAALYWHFVDIVWIVIFAVVYLIGVGVS